MNETPPEEPSHRSWIAKFGDAFRGLRFGAGQSSFIVHCVFAVAVVVCGFVLQVDSHEWQVLLLCIGIVMSAEMFNSAIESLARAVDRQRNQDIGRALDMASGAVLLVALTSAIGGLLIFVPRLLPFFR